MSVIAELSFFLLVKHGKSISLKLKSVSFMKINQQQQSINNIPEETTASGSGGNGSKCVGSQKHLCCPAMSSYIFN